MTGTLPLKNPHMPFNALGLAPSLAQAAAELGFTHLELMPVSEHPFDGSWGYQTLGLFAPSSRFGDAAGFRRFVDRAHAAGLPDARSGAGAD